MLEKLTDHCARLQGKLKLQLSEIFFYRYPVYPLKTLTCNIDGRSLAVLLRRVWEDAFRLLVKPFIYTGPGTSGLSSASTFFTDLIRSVSSAFN